MTAAVDDEARWAEAQALLLRAPTEAPHRRAARECYDRRALLIAVVLFCTAVVVALVLLVVDPPPDRGDPPTWQVVTGLTVAVPGLLLGLLGAAARPFGARRGLDRPLGALSPGQRVELTQQVRGRAPVVPERLDLARLEAERLLDRRARLPLPTGLVVAFVGLWSVQPSMAGTLMTAAFGLMMGSVAVPILRDARRARRFLAEHVDPTGG